MKIDCSKTENYLREYGRMCTLRADCRECPMNKMELEYKMNCHSAAAEHPQEAIAAVQQWSDEHPQKTYAEDFFEKFPWAKRDTKGDPDLCWQYAYGDNGYCEGGVEKCHNCWNRPTEE